MNTIVIDSSVVIKWYLPEDDTLIASTIQDKLEAGDWRVFAPDLLLAEIANILWKRRHEIIETDALGILQEVISSGIEFAAIEPFIESAYQIARQLERTVYDSLYIALARQHDCNFVTADQRLVNSVTKSEQRVKLLRDYLTTI